MTTPSTPEERELFDSIPEADRQGLAVEVAVANICDAFVAEGQWDVPPSLGLIFDDGTSLIFTDLEVPERIWHAAGHPARVVETLGHPDAPGLPSLCPPGSDVKLRPVGAYLRTEGYGVSPRKDDPRGMEYWATHRMADEPDGYETVQTIAVLSDGTSYGIVRRRDGVAVPDMGESGSLGGRVVDALTQMIGHQIAATPMED